MYKSFGYNFVPGETRIKNEYVSYTLCDDNFEKVLIVKREIIPSKGNKYIYYSNVFCQEILEFLIENYKNNNLEFNLYLFCRDFGGTRKPIEKIIQKEYPKIYEKFLMFDLLK